MPFKVPFLSESDLSQRADDFLREYHPGRQIPVPIEWIIEKAFHMDIVPMPGLQDTFDVVGFITKDLTEIRIDESVYLHRENRYRFTLAHEVGHRILHADLWAQLSSFDDIESWKSVVMDGIPEREYGFMEYQANSFAGHVLVPSTELQTVFDEVVDKARRGGVSVDSKAPDAIKAILESEIANSFCVSAEVVHRRLEREGFWSSP